MLPPSIGPFGVISPEDDKFLNDMEQANFNIFGNRPIPRPAW